MKKLFVIGIVLSLIFASCQKEDEPKQTLKSSYLQLDVGNYWIYQNIKIDADGEESLEPKLDSVVITGDTIIKGKVYSIMEGTNLTFNGGQWGVLHFLKDSLSYLVNENGEILFSEYNFTDVLNTKTEIMGGDTLYTSYYKMENENSVISIPAGNFNVLNFKGDVYVSEAITDIPNPRFINQYYADNVGKVFSSYFYVVSNGRIEQRLVRYHIKE